jgi:hypothetical protein
MKANLVLDEAQMKVAAEEEKKRRRETYYMQVGLD